MIERYLDYLSAIRRYSPRTIEIYRGVLEDFCIYSRRGELPPETSGDSAGPLPLPSEAGPSLLRSRGWLRFPEAVAASASLTPDGGRSPWSEVYASKSSNTPR